MFKLTDREMITNTYYHITDDQKLLHESNINRIHRHARLAFNLITVV